MIITCRECSSIFNLDDSLIKVKGSKVRCSVCQHIFTVYPPSHEEDVPESALFSDDDTELEIENSELSFDEWDKQIDEGIFFEKEPISEKELKKYDDSSSAVPQDTKEKREPYLQSAEEKKPKSVFSTLILIITLVFLLAAGTYVAGIATGYKIPYLSEIKIPIVQEYIEKLLPKGPEVKPILNNTIINDRFMTNPTAGTLFVITGQVDNPTEETFSYIELEAALATGEKEKAIVRKIFCGNIVSDEMLRNGDIVEIEQLLTVREGQNNANMNIKPNSSVPFMVVFSKLPDKLQTYYIKVNSFEKGDGLH
jgi:predicted Zn finger-like uncharacterized protein